MKSKNKIILTVLSFIMLSLMVLPNLKADLDPVKINEAQILADAGIIVDNSKNPSAYNLGNSISRREMLKVMLNLAGIRPLEKCEGKFADLKSADWGCKYAEEGLRLGYLAPNKFFRPNDNVSKVEALKMIFKAKNITVTQTSDWRVGYVQKAVELGYTTTFKDYDTSSLRSFVFSVGSKTITGVSGIKLSTVKEEILTYEKPKLLLTFANDMNRTSVLSNLKVYPEVKYSTNWVDDKNLELVVDDLIKEDIDLLINILDNAITSSGTKLENTYVKKFKIDGEALIDFVTPDGAITDLNQNITVRFSKPMVPLTNLDNQLKCPIEITPNIPGKCVWITTSTFQFRPESGFPAGGNYFVSIPSGITTIAGDKTINSKSFEISTMDFALVSDITSLNKDEKLNFVFNDEVSIDKFKSNFTLSSINNDKLNFTYYRGENDLEESKNIISVYPTSGDWGYSKSYTYTISKNLTSSRGNVGLKNTISKIIKTNDFLLSYSPVVFLNPTAEDKYTSSNLKHSQNIGIITGENPSVILNFYEEVALDKSLFSSSLPFNLNYVKISQYVDNKETFKEDKKQVLITFSGNVSGSFSLKLLLSKISSTSDKVLSFNTKENNKIIDYKQVNYKKACLTISNDIGYNVGNNKSFEFDKYGKVDYIYEINQYTKDNDCSFESGKNKYIVNTRLNPENDYKLTIKRSLLDNDNYPLDKDYIFSFKTPKALNEDKQISIIDARPLVLVPNDIKPLSIGIQSVNLSQVSAKVCNGDINVLSTDYIKNPECITKTITLNNLGFKQNISIIDLEKVYGKTFDKKFITVEVSKLSADKTEYEAKNDYYIAKTSFIISDISATIKSAKNNLLWLHNYSSGVNLTDSISKIESYKKEAKYSVFGGYEGEKVVLVKEISFTSKADGMYELAESNFTTLLITLKTGEQVLLDNVYSYYYASNNIYTYITTDRPIYKAGDTVSIAGISRKLNAKGYDLNSGSLQMYVRDAQYKEVLNKTVTLNSLGAYEISFDLKDDAKLGNYTVEIGGNNLSFAVEEYEKPDFKIETSGENTSYLYSDKAKIDVSGEYYIGLPLSNGEGKYSLSSSEFYFDGGKTTGYTFGEQRNFWWDYGIMSSRKGDGISYGGYDSNSNIEKTGNFVLNADGKATLNIDLESSEKDKVYLVSTTVSDPNTKKSISSNTSFKAIRSKTFLGIKFDKYYYAFKDTASIGFVTTDIQGNKLPGENFKFKVYKVDYIYNENSFNFDTKETLVSEKSVSTNSSGIASQSFIFDNYGEYRFEMDNGKYKTTKTIYVSGADVLRPIEAQNNIEILSIKDNYKVGETASVVISSPVIGVKALLTIEKLDEIINYKVIDIDSYNKEVQLDIKKEYLPNFDVGVYIIKDVKTATESLDRLKTLRVEMLDIEKQLQKESEGYMISYLIYDLSSLHILPIPTDENLDKDLLTKLANLRTEEKDLLNKILPEYYVGTKTIKVDSESIKLNSQIKLDKTSYLPGDKQKIELTITDNTGKPVTGETTISIIDESLLALKDNKTEIVNYFYSDKDSLVTTIGNLTNLIKRIEFNVEDNVGTTTSDSFGGTMDKSMNLGAVAESAPMSNMVMDEERGISNSGDDGLQNTNATKLRTEFKDLAFYKTKVSVINGKAILEIPALPDNLTTWVISGFAYTSDTKVGNFENKFKVQKELSLLPQIPRFFLSGDKAQISALVVNNTSSPKDVKVNIDMTNVNILEKIKNINVGANSSSLVAFDVEIGTGELQNTTSSNISLTAKSGELVDSIKVSKPIYPSKTSEYVFTNGSTNDLSYEEKVDFDSVSKNGGYLEVSLGATILTNLTKNLDKVLYFPSDDLSSKITFLKNALALEELYKKLDKSSDFENIILTDYNGQTYKVGEVITLVKNDIKDYVQADNGLSYYKDCSSWWSYESCSNLDVTGNFLNLNIEVDLVDNSKLLEYYKNALIKKIEESKQYQDYTEITDFFPIALYKDTAFITKYFNPKTDLSNIEKLDYIKLYNLSGVSGDKTIQYIKDLKNAVLVEARGSVLPADKSYSRFDNSVSSAKMISVLIDSGNSEKLLLENLVRFLISNRDEQGNYYTYDFNEIISAINKYVDFTNELKDVNFTAKAYLNSKDIMTSTFGESNKFDIDKKVFNFNDYLISGENSLGFEKTGNGKLYYDIGVRYYIPVSEMTSREEGITVVRNYYNYDEYNLAFKKDCITPWWYYDFGGYCFTKKVKNIDSIKTANKGDYIVGEIEILLDKDRVDVVVQDYLPAGAEILNTNFNTTSAEVKDISGQANKSWWYGGFDFVEQKDDRIYLFAKHLLPGSYKYTYVLKVNHIGNYNLKPATAELLDKPEIWGRSNGGKFEIK